MGRAGCRPISRAEDPPNHTLHALEIRVYGPDGGLVSQFTVACDPLGEQIVVGHADGEIHCEGRGSTVGRALIEALAASRWPLVMGWVDGGSGTDTAPPELRDMGDVWSLFDSGVFLATGG